jgi:diguanylate cyclase (GGDEF)-like protein/putative nucleotidyltransferase with HDIG domain
VPVQVEKNQAQGVMVSCEDITISELQRMEMVRVLAELRKSEAEIKVKNHELEFLAAHDPLTECRNRRSFYVTYQALASEPTCLPCSLVMCDIDFFKRVNDQHGHGRGDAVLRHVGAILRSLAPDTANVFRMGGEEFCVLLPNCHAASAMEIAEAMREAVAETKLDDLAVTASFGVMTLFSSDPSPDSLLENADRALYDSKRAGRNRVTHYDQLSEVQDASQSCALGGVQGGTNATMSLGAISALMKTLAYREPSTASHSMRVANLCVLVAGRLLPKAEVHLLEAAALLHDIGKIGIPDAILLKPDKLTPQEWAIMDEHDVYSREIIKAALGSADLVRIVENHHAYFGESRKDLPMGRAIPLGARILAVCDAYDSMVSDRVYRKGCSTVDALEELRRCAPRQFDPDIVEVFAVVIEQTETPSIGLVDSLIIDPATSSSIASQLLQSLDQQLLALNAALADNDFAAIRQLSTDLAQRWKGRPEVGDLQQDFDRLYHGLADEHADWLDIQEQAVAMVEHCRAAQDTLLTHDFCNRVERSLHRLIRPQSQHN